jgi:hypothetical protein
MTIIRSLLVAALVLVASACAAETETPAAEAADEGPQTNSGNDTNPPPDDVELTDCIADDVGWIKASGTITNHSSEASTYFINVEFVASDGVRYAEGIATSSTVAPDQTAEWEASGLTEAREATTCNVTAVDRYAS